VIHELNLTNFRKVVNANMVFTPGLNVLRGSNEASKTTRLEAMLYALFGSSCLRTSLDDTVTWGQDVKSLKVELHLTFDGVPYSVQRSKAGAEVRFGDQTVTGQTEVKKFFERLFGCTADMAQKLMIASQNSIRGALESGPTATAAMIEQLANLQVIESLIEKIQVGRPCGNTRATEARVEALKARAGTVPPEPDQEPVLRAEAQVQKCEREAKHERELLILAESAAANAQVTMQKAASVATRNKATKVQQSRLQEAASRTPVEPGTSREKIQEWTALEGQVQERERLLALFKTKFPVAEQVWEGDWASFVEAKDNALAEANHWRKGVVEGREKVRELEVQLITEDVCPLCQKDLSQVPEVVAINTKVGAQLAAARQAYEEAKKQQGEADLLLRDMLAIETLATRIRDKAVAPWTLDESTVPPTPVWGGPEVTDDLQSRAKEIAALSLAWANFDRSIALQQQAQAELERLTFEQEVDTTQAQADIQALRTQQAAYQEANQALNTAMLAAKDARARYDQAVALRQQALQQAEIVRQDLESAQHEVQQMQFYNELIRKLRDARPVIANKLWGSVLAGVGSYFSQIRGEKSVVSRTEDGFTVNGSGVAGLSGSTLDALGLAIRLALVKTFMPTVGFISLDEPAAACDEQRELAMLGVIAAAGFDQVILVTHSDAPEALAQNLVQI
jgi:DNA repair exonuclease SbcCD ATPase subunit